MPYPSSAQVTITASASLNRNTHAGNIVNLSAAAGLTVTLPASAGTGDVYEVFVLTTVTSNNYIIQVANATDILAGAVHGHRRHVDADFDYLGYHHHERHHHGRPARLLAAVQGRVYRLLGSGRRNHLHRNRGDAF